MTWAEDPERKKREDEADERKKEKLIDEDDEIALKRAREFDEWKDGKFNKFLIVINDLNLKSNF